MLLNCVFAVITGVMFGLWCTEYERTKQLTAEIERLKAIIQFYLNEIKND